MQETKTKTVAEIVTLNIKSADVFKKHGIDFCCGGDISLSEACEVKGIKVSVVEKELKKLMVRAKKGHDFDNWKLDFLIDFIENTHHTYVKNNVELVVEYTEKVAEVHGDTHPEVIQINALTKSLVAELVPHLQKEEHILFPMIKQLLGIKSRGEKVSSLGVQSPIRVMHMEHENAGEIILEIARLSNNFKAPEGACNTFLAMYAKLKEFQDDLFQHIHLENNILFPKAILLEEEISL
jgi:regulator of cell morphogenesis and NO signaling